MGKGRAQAKPEKKQKPINKKHKYIWFAVSMAVFVLGVILAKSGISFENYAFKAVYALAVFFPLLVAAQKVSCERVNPETGKKNIPAYIMYYFCVALFIALIPIIFWVNQFVSI